MNRTTPLAIILSAVASLAVQFTPVRADITYTGQIDPDDPADWISSKDGYIGKTEDGSLTITNNSYLISNQAFIGYANNVNGKVTLNGLNASLWALSGLYVGYYGKGTLDIFNCRSPIISSPVIIGSESGSIGEISLSNSHWSPGEIIIGNSGCGTLSISDDSVVADGSGMLYMGYYTGSEGIMKVDGEKSKLLRSNLCVGLSGKATLEITNGASVGISYGNVINVGVESGSTGTITVSGANSECGAGGLYVGQSGIGTLNIFDDAVVNVSGTTSGITSVGNLDSSINFRANGTLNTQTLFAGTKQLHGTGAINTLGIVGDCDLVFDSSTGSTAALTLNSSSDQNIIITVDASGNTGKKGKLGAGYLEKGTLCIRDGVKVYSDGGQVGYFAGSTGTVVVEGQGTLWDGGGGIGVYGRGILSILDGAVVKGGGIGLYAGSIGEVTVDGDGSKWTHDNYLNVGTSGTGTLNIRNGSTVESARCILGYEENSLGSVTIDGEDSSLSVSSYFMIGNKGKGVLHVSGGGIVSTDHIYVKPYCLLAIDVGYESSIALHGSSETFTNYIYGTVRILAGAGVTADDTPYAPITATTWEGTGVYQAVGGTWDGTNHKFYVSETLSGKAGDTISLVLSETQRALVVDDEGENPTGWTVGASFLHKTGTNTDLDFTASVVIGESLELLVEKSGGEKVKGAWEFAVSGDGYATDDPVYLSFAVGAGINRNDLHVWHFDGSEWTAFDAMDLTVNDGWASFTAAGFSGYAVTVPEPGTLILLAVAAIGLAAFARGQRRQIA